MMSTLCFLFISFLYFIFNSSQHQHRSSRSEKPKDDGSSKSKHHSSSHRSASAKSSKQEDATSSAAAAAVNSPNQFDPLSSSGALPESGASAGVTKSTHFRGSGVICSDSCLSLVCFFCVFRDDFSFRIVVLFLAILARQPALLTAPASFYPFRRASKHARARPTRRLSLSPSR
jgi:hypothetical protein